MNAEQVIELKWGEPKNLIECGSDWMTTAQVPLFWRKPGVYAWVHDHDGLIYIGMARRDLLGRQNEHYRAFIRGGYFINGLSEHLGRSIPWLGFPSRNKAEKQKAFEDVAEVLRDKQTYMKLVEFAYDYAQRIQIYVAPALDSWSPATIPQVEAQLIYDFGRGADEHSPLQNEQGQYTNPGYNFKWKVTGPDVIRGYF